MHRIWWHLNQVLTITVPVTVNLTKLHFKESCLHTATRTSVSQTNTDCRSMAQCICMDASTSAYWTVAKSLRSEFKIHLPFLLIWRLTKLFFLNILYLFEKQKYIKFSFAVQDICIPQMSATPKARPGPKPGARNPIQVSHTDSRTPKATTVFLR